MLALTAPKVNDPSGGTSETSDLASPLGLAHLPISRLFYVDNWHSTRDGLRPCPDHSGLRGKVVGVLQASEQLCH